MVYIVYKTTNLINKKIYVGVHYEDPENPSTYIGCGVTKKDKKKKVKTGFPAAVRKYGYENFRRETLFEYPGTKAGKIAAYKKEAEIVDEEFVAREDTYNLVVGGGHPPYEILKKKIAQYDLNGTFIKTWNSILDAERALGISNITATLTGRYHICGGYQWRYFTNCENISAATCKEKVVYQFDLQGNLIKVHKSIAIAVQQFDNSESAKVAITRVCKGKAIQCKGYFWSYTNKFTPKIKEYLQMPVAKYTDDGVFIESFSSIIEAATSLGLKNGNDIMRAIKGSCKRCKGFRWRYFYGNTSNIKPLKNKI